MPFQTTSIVPPTRPQVTIAFAGLMVIQPGANNTAEVGIHRFNTSHETRATLIVQRPDRPPILVSLLQGPLEGQFEISLRPDPNPAMGDFSVFAPTAEPFVRNAAGNHELDYRWAVNVKELHPGVELNNGAQPFVVLKTGILYTPSRTIERVHPKFVGRGERPPEIEMHRIASSLAAAIITPAGSRVFLIWRDFGGTVDLELPRRTDPINTCYTILFSNEPTKLKPEPHDEMMLYYRILHDTGGEVRDSQRFKIVYTTESPVTDEVPCLAMTKNP